MHTTEKELFNVIVIASIFFVLLIVIIIITALLYHSRKRIHKIEVSNFQNTLVQAQYEAREQTMQTIGADLHDNIGQLLSLISLTLNTVELDNHAKARQKIEDAIELTLRSIKEMRLLGKLLEGDQLILQGLHEAIRQEIRWLEKSGKYQVSYAQAEELPASQNRDKDLLLFRALQEIINNIIKHAAATTIDISLEYQDSTLKLEVLDDGDGFDVNQEPVREGGMGLHNIRRRISMIDGQVTVQSGPGKGTRVRIEISYP